METIFCTAKVRIGKDEYFCILPEGHINHTHYSPLICNEIEVQITWSDFVKFKDVKKLREKKT